jgi:hypothetical protein
MDAGWLDHNLSLKINCCEHDLQKFQCFKVDCLDCEQAIWSNIYGFTS